MISNFIIILDIAYYPYQIVKWKEIFFVKIQLSISMLAEDWIIFLFPV